MTGRVHISSNVTGAAFTQVWRSEDGTIHTSVSLGRADLVFDDSASARQAAAAILEAADAWDALEAESPGKK